MAQLDSSIYRGVPAIDLSQATEGFERGMKLGDMVRQRKTQELEAQKQAAIKDAFNKSYETAPDGSQVFNPMKLKDLVRGAGYGQDAEMLADDYQKKALEEQKLNFEKQSTKILGGYQLLNTVKDQSTLENARREALRLGYTQDEINQNLPSVYDPQTIGVLREQLGQASIPYAQKLENDRKAQEAAARFKQLEFDNNIALANLNLSKKKAEAEAEEKKTKKNELSVMQAKQVGNYKLGALAEQQYQKAISDKDNYDPTQVGQVIDNSSWAPKWMKNDKAIEAAQAADSWIETFLRDASGAAIAPSERGAYKEIYFEMPGDTEQTIKNKKMLREQKMQSAAIAAGRDDLYSYEEGGQPPQQKQLSGQDVEALSWAEKNPNDPRAAKIIERLRGAQ